jgi:hypothetical protein
VAPPHRPRAGLARNTIRRYLRGGAAAEVQERPTVSAPRQPRLDGRLEPLERPLVHDLPDSSPAASSAIRYPDDAVDPNQPRRRGAPCDQLGRTSGDLFGRTNRDQRALRNHIHPPERPRWTWRIAM